MTAAPPSHPTPAAPAVSDVSGASGASGARRPGAWKYEPRSVAGRRIVVTGGTTGSGRSIALLLAELGAKIVLFGRHEEPLNEALGDLAAYRDRVWGLTADAAHEADIDRVFAHADDRMGGLDILINNAGLPAGSITESEPDEYRYIIETNLLGYMSCAKRAVARMKKTGGGSIVNIGSMSAEAKGPGSDVYTATKNGLRGFVEALARQVQKDEIHVGLIEPGKFGADFRTESQAKQERQQREGQLLFSEAIAESVLYMLTTPAHCRIPFLQIQPLHQEVG